MKHILTTLLIFAFPLFPLFSQTELRLTGPASARIGDPVTFTVAGIGGGPAAVQMDVALPPATILSNITTTLGAAALAASKQISCTVPGISIRCVVWGNNATPILNGELLRITGTAISIPPAPGTASATLSNGVASSPTATAVVVQMLAVLASVNILPVLNKCDVTGDNLTTQLDVTATLNQVLTGVPPGGTRIDFDGDGRTTVIDLIVVVISAGGGTCLAI